MTRAITVDAQAEAVWPWLAQMGPFPRGGAYTYDWIENLLGLDMRSVERVLPEFQHPKVGDTIGLGSNPMRLEFVDPPHALAWRSEDGNWVWAFVLKEKEATTTTQGYIDLAGETFREEADRLERRLWGNAPSAEESMEPETLQASRIAVSGRVAPNPTP